MTKPGLPAYIEILALPAGLSITILLTAADLVFQIDTFLSLYLGEVDPHKTFLQTILSPKYD